MPRRHARGCSASAGKKHRDAGQHREEEEDQTQHHAAKLLPSESLRPHVDVVMNKFGCADRPWRSAAAAAALALGIAALAVVLDLHAMQLGLEVGPAAVHFDGEGRTGARVTARTNASSSAWFSTVSVDRIQCSYHFHHHTRKAGTQVLPLANLQTGWDGAVATFPSDLNELNIYFRDVNVSSMKRMAILSGLFGGQHGASVSIRSSCEVRVDVAVGRVIPYRTTFIEEHDLPLVEAGEQSLFERGARDWMAAAHSSDVFSAPSQGDAQAWLRAAASAIAKVLRRDVAFAAELNTSSMSEHVVEHDGMRIDLRSMELTMHLPELNYEISISDESGQNGTAAGWNAWVPAQTLRLLAGEQQQSSFRYNISCFVADAATGQSMPPHGLEWLPTVLRQAQQFAIDPQFGVQPKLQYAAKKMERATPLLDGSLLHAVGQFETLANQKCALFDLPYALAMSFSRESHVAVVPIESGASHVEKQTLLHSFVEAVSPSAKEQQHSARRQMSDYGIAAANDNLNYSCYNLTKMWSSVVADVSEVVSDIEEDGVAVDLVAICFSNFSDFGDDWHMQLFDRGGNLSMSLGWRLAGFSDTDIFVLEHQKQRAATIELNVHNDVLFLSEGFHLRAVTNLDSSWTSTNTREDASLDLGIDVHMSGFEHVCLGGTRECHEIGDEDTCSNGTNSACAWSFHNPSHPEHGGYCDCGPDGCEFCAEDKVLQNNVSSFHAGLHGVHLNVSSDW
eukprot:SAG22_NODE_4_length_44774_cov_362.122149_35_plen_735_part_00